MPIFNCPHCGQRTEADETQVGGQAICSFCNKPMAVSPSLPAAQALAEQLAHGRSVRRASTVRAAPAVQVVVTQPNRHSHSLGIAAIILGLTALVFLFVPVVGAIVSLPLGAVGLLLGFIGIIVAAGRRGSGLGYAIAGTAMALLSLAIIGLCMYGLWQFLKDSGGPDQQASTAIVAEAEQPPSGEAPHSASAPAPEWAVASDTSLRQGDVRVRITSAKVGRVPIVDWLGGESLTEQAFLMVHVNIENIGSTRKVEYEGWGVGATFLGSGVKAVTDDLANCYRRVTLGFTQRAKGQVVRESIYPGTSVADVVLFERPIDAAQFLRIELPASAFGGQGHLRFEIPKAWIQ